MNLVINIHGPVTVTVPALDNLEETMNELTDVVQAQVAEDSIIVGLLDKWEAQASTGADISADELAADIATLRGEHDKLVAAASADSSLPGISTSGTGPVSAPGSAPGDPTVPPAGTVVGVSPDPLTGTPAVPDAPVSSEPVPVADAPATPSEAPGLEAPAS